MSGLTEVSQSCDVVSTAHLFVVSIRRLNVSHVTASSSLSYDLNGLLFGSQCGTLHC